MGFVELADERQRAHNVGGKVFGEVEEVGNGRLGIGVGRHVERVERVEGAESLDRLLDGRRRRRVLTRRDGFVRRVGLHDGFGSRHFEWRVL